ncbi:GSCFA domain-containing protein [Marinilongibacter aquaticus]|uniref:GSCFA domain-containing protein n=1 Tax=Marinilongibacter aquaticus TaxID=2975157 RepID=UPI0021BD4768|nr:GSCFA domain-containing protein [Marinilongibacter aquaticus]UBM60156.1 GSCFA domain-containing protein [Marinilongibacter aquaticus]
MQFRTEIEPFAYPFKIEERNKILCIGSCFSDKIGNYLVENKMDCMANPYGLIFNPISVFRLLGQSLREQRVMENYLTENQGTWYHYDFHSKHSGAEPGQLTNDLNQLHADVRNFIRKCDYIVITLGTAFVHRLKNNQHIVANCHKKPASLFQRELLTQKEIGIRFRQFYEKLKLSNPKVKIIFTVSPVRHTKDGLQGNSLSKSILRMAAHYFCMDFRDVFYFPSYEMLIDDLRDYRYYEADMIHVNQSGQEYVINKFQEAAFSDTLKAFIAQWQQLRSQLNHKAFHPSSEQHQAFLRKLLERLENFAQKVDVSKEKEWVKAQLL